MLNSFFQYLSSVFLLIQISYMKINFTISGKNFSSDLSDGRRISIPMIFNGDQPNTYDVPRAESHPYETGNFIGDTRQGGSCNFEEIKLIPHCNGTHTECVGHISLERISLHDILKDTLIPSTLVTVQPEHALETADTYDPLKSEEDMLITAKCISDSMSGKSDFLQGLIIRSIPNEFSKTSRHYMNNPPPFFSIEAIELINSFGVEHLLVDFPSLDRTLDEGKLTAHHIFWNVERGSNDVNPFECSMKTVTEMIFVPNDIQDGNYLTNIQIPDFVAEAVPSRVFLYEAKYQK